MLAALGTFLTALSLFFGRPQPAPISTSTTSTTSSSCSRPSWGSRPAWFSASYIGHELEIGRLTPTFLRFYHACTSS